MSYSVKLISEARTDIREIIAYYEEEKTGLGTRFYKGLVNALKLAAKNPMIFQIRYKNIRHVSIKKFPIQIHYVVDERAKQVIVIGATHTSRNPQIWKDRT